LHPPSRFFSFPSHISIRSFKPRAKTCSPGARQLIDFDSQILYCISPKIPKLNLFVNKKLRKYHRNIEIFCNSISRANFNSFSKKCHPICFRHEQDTRSKLPVQRLRFHAHVLNFGLAIECFFQGNKSESVKIGVGCARPTVCVTCVWAWILFGRRKNPKPKNARKCRRIQGHALSGVVFYIYSNEKRLAGFKGYNLCL